MTKTDKGDWISDRTEIQETILSFYENIFQTDQYNGNGASWEEARDLIGLLPRITNQHQAESLQEKFSNQEMSEAVMQMAPLKAPGPDGILAIFYQRHWETMGHDVMAAVQYFFFFDKGYIMREWNTTLICLIPKVDKLEEAGQFMPISLCNVIYKIISKMLVNHLKPIIQELVSPFQNAFIPDRLLSDNVLIAHEMVDKIWKGKRGKAFMAALKIDMFKAYDKVNWKFLEWLLDNMNFPPQCRHWIMQCVNTVTYSILVNGEPTRSFRPACGLRHGDPLSPFLFILVMEAFSRMIVHAERQNLFEGIKISRCSPSISHLFLTDDSLLFFKASPQSCATIRNLIEEI